MGKGENLEWGEYTIHTPETKKRGRRRMWMVGRVYVDREVRRSCGGEMGKESGEEGGRGWLVGWSRILFFLFVSFR